MNEKLISNPELIEIAKQEIIADSGLWRIQEVVCITVKGVESIKKEKTFARQIIESVGMVFDDIALYKINQ